MAEDIMDNLLSTLRAAGEPTRLRILAVLSHGELTVSELVYVLRQSQPRISRHLKLLADAGLVIRFPEASWIFYRLAKNSAAGELGQYLVSRLNENTAALDTDMTRLLHVRKERQDKAETYFAENAPRWNEISALHIPETQVEARMLSFLPNDPVALLVDLGTGTGRMLEVFGPHVTEAIGFDSSPDMLTLARSRLSNLGQENCQVRQGDIVGLPLGPGQADILIMHQVLHFVDDPTMALAEAARVLKPGGRILIADFAAHDLVYLRDEHAHRRLGFRDIDIENWLNEHDLVLDVSEHMTSTSGNTDLEVVLWVATKSPLPIVL